MKPFRKYLAIAVDGGGVRGGIATRAMRRVEEHLKIRLPDVVNLLVGTSAGAIVAAALACDMSATDLDALFPQFCQDIFKKTWRSLMPFKYFAPYQYPNAAFIRQLKNVLAEMTFDEFTRKWPNRRLVTTTFDVLENRTRFLKTGKPEYKDWPLYKAILASAAAPTYFPVVDGRYIDGGVGSYNNPCYLAAYEIKYTLKLDPKDVTLLSLGAGRAPALVKPGQAEKFSALEWLNPILDGFSYSADDQQVGLVDTFFPELDFRRFQVDLQESTPLDNARVLDKVQEYGEQMAEMVLADQLDRAMIVRPERTFYEKNGPKAGLKNL